MIAVCRLAAPGFLNQLIAAAMAFRSVFVVTYCLGRRRFQPAVGLADTYLACLVTGLGEERGSLSCGGIDRGSEAGHSPRQIDQGWVSL